MLTPVRIFGTALGAAAIIGSSAVGASAHDVGGHRGGGHHGHDGAYSVRGAHQQFADFTRHHEGRGHDGDWFGVGRDFNQQWYRHHWSRHHHQQLTFAEKRDAIVARLTHADSRLGDLITRLQAAAADDPSGWEAQAVPYLQQQQIRLETLIDAVKAATSYREVAAAFREAFTPPAPTPAD